MDLFNLIKKDAHGTLNTQLITHLRTQIHQVVIHKTCMRVMVFYVHEAESIFLVKGNSLQICVNSQESASSLVLEYKHRLDVILLRKRLNSFFILEVSDGHFVICQTTISQHAPCFGVSTGITHG